MRQGMTVGAIVGWILLLGVGLAACGIAGYWYGAQQKNAMQTTGTITIGDVLDQLSGVEGELNGKFESLRVFAGDLWDRIEDHNVPTIETVVPEVIPGVVHVKCPQWQGSGFVVGPRLIATARHVVEGVTDFTITTHEGHRLQATRAISFKDRDVGFIWIDDLRCVSEVARELECAKVKHEVKLHVLGLGSIKECSLGQSVFAVGSPYGKINFNHLSSGIISALDRDWNDLGEDYGWEIGWVTTISAHPGNSGCPVFTLDGRVRGILVGGFSPVLVIAMPVDLFLGYLDEVVTMFEMERFKLEGQLTPQEVLDLLRNYENRNGWNIEEIRRKIEEIEGRISEIEKSESEPNSVCIVIINED